MADYGMRDAMDIGVIGGHISRLNVFWNTDYDGWKKIYFGIALSPLVKRTGRVG